MRRLALALAALALCAAPAVAAPPTATPGVLVVGVDMPSPGFEVGAVKGSQVLVARGFEIAFARALAARLGVPAVRFYQEGQFPRLFSAGPKPWDVAIAQISITDARAVTAEFSGPYMTVDQGVLLSRAVPAGSTSLAAIRGLQTCSLADSTGAAAITQQLVPSKPPRLYGNVTLLMQALQLGRCAAVVYDAPSLASLRAQAPARYGVFAGVLRTGERYGVALPRGSALTGAVTGAVASLVADGTVARLQKQWLTANLAKIPVIG